MSEVVTSSLDDVVTERSQTNSGARAVAMPYLGSAAPVGLVGAATVAVFVFLLDTLAGHPLGTPNALGAALLRGEAVPLDAPIQAGLVFGYTLLHAAAFVVVATAAVSAEFTLSRAGMPAGAQVLVGSIALVVALTVILGILFGLLGIEWVGGFERILTVNTIAALSMAITVHLRGEGRRGERAVLAEARAR